MITNRQPYSFPALSTSPVTFLTLQPPPHQSLPFPPLSLLHTSRAIQTPPTPPAPCHRLSCRAVPKPALLSHNSVLLFACPLDHRSQGRLLLTSLILRWKVKSFSRLPLLLLTLWAFSYFLHATLHPCLQPFKHFDTKL